MKKLFYFLTLILFTTSAHSQVNLQLLGHLAFPSTTCAGVWQYVDSLGNEYALVGAGNGIAIVDITDPANPALLFTVSAAQSLWRELKTYGNYAYAGTEGGGGITIVNLSYLPDSVPSKVWTGDGAIAGQLSSSHTVGITDGYLYVYGANIGNGGVIIADLNADPWNPQYVGQYQTEYIHDGYVLNDTLWAGEIYAGQFSVIDVTNKSNPALVATQATPGAFCHNTWLSDNGKYLYTTDEVNNAPLGVFDISNLSNIQLVETYFTNLMFSEEVHNVRVINDFLICPSYGSQITIVDGARPENLVEIASYPTGSFLCWDASPYLPSGNIIATDVGGGLYIFAPYYVRACYLEGIVTDSITGLPINTASVQILSTSISTLSNITGEYKTGIPDSGTYAIEVSKAGYVTKTFTGVTLTNGNLAQLDAELVPFVINGQVIEAGSGNPVPNAKVRIENASLFTEIPTDVNGNFSITTLTSGVYDVTAAKWGYKSNCINALLDGSSPVVIAIENGIYDDFTFDWGWQITSTATNGNWTRDLPIGTLFGTTQANPDTDAVDDCSQLCYMTGNGGGTGNNDDVDDGYTILTSPVLDLSSYTDPYLNYERWFFTVLTGNPAANDTMTVYLDNGTATVPVEIITGNAPDNSTWATRSFQISNFLTPTATMYVIAYIEDKSGSGNPLEGGFDKFQISEGPLGIDQVTEEENVLKIYPNPFSNSFMLLIKNLEKSDQAVISITDITGKTVETISVDGKEQLELGQSLKTGIYFIRLMNDEIISKPLKIVKAE